jgi:asparagine synthase (glutamine-hydrolysing)
MCGLTGFIDLRRQTPQDRLEDLARRMADTILHRGPDDGGVWADAEAGVALGFRRLSIVDLTAAGHQPMLSADGRHVIVYNGEVYNAEELRPELEARGVHLRGHSDTEVILEACAAWGVEPTLQRLVGMFAIAIWDIKARTLTLARDRLGKKPLYWGRIGSTVFFGSQPKSFFVHPDWRPEIDRDSLALYLRFNNVPAPRSIFRGLAQLSPGSLVVIREGAAQGRRYWSVADVAQRGVADRMAMDDDAAVEQLDHILRDAVRRRMVADVPLGAFLSGGIDSSAVVALMQAQSNVPIKTFSIGYDEKQYDEAPHARAVARHLGTEHHELYVRPQDAIDVIPGLSDYYDEPFADSSQIPTLLVSALARRHVTVALSGDGGDELFAGYPRYARGCEVTAAASQAPRAIRAFMRGAIRTVSPRGWDLAARLLPAAIRPANVGIRAHRLADLIDTGGEEALYRDFMTHWHHPETMLTAGREPVDPIWTGTLVRSVPNFLERMQLIDTMTYLPNDILTKVDRASMAVSLEARVPLLDHRVVEFAWRLPVRFKVRNGTSKWILRQVLYRYVPPALVERPKMGFGVPIDEWLRGRLRDWAEDLLSEKAMKSDGLFHPGPIHARWKEHLSGRANWQYQLWVILMFQAWKRRWLGA